jgi:hypothetical protein
MTCNFEWSLVTGQRKFRWPLVSQIQKPFIAQVLIMTQSACQLDYRFMDVVMMLEWAVFFFLSRYCMLFSFIGL